MNEDIEFESFEKICRTCMTPSDTLKSLFKTGKICGRLTKLSTILEDFLCMKVRFIINIGHYIRTNYFIII